MGLVAWIKDDWLIDWLCVKMRYVILCIKRLLIDWLIDVIAQLFCDYLHL